MLSPVSIADSHSHPKEMMFTNAKVSTSIINMGMGWWQVIVIVIVEDNVLDVQSSCGAMSEQKWSQSAAPWNRFNGNSTSKIHNANLDNIWIGCHCCHDNTNQAWENSFLECIKSECERLTNKSILLSEHFKILLREHLDPSEHFTSQICTIERTQFVYQKHSKMLRCAETEHTEGVGWKPTLENQ